MAFVTGGAFPAGLTPSPTKTLFDGNYLAIGSNDFNFTKQFLPEVYEKEVERYGNRSISSFLRMVGAEMPMASDEVVWTEQGRLHVAYNDAVFASTTSTEKTLNITGHAIRQNQTVIIANGYSTLRGFVQAVAADGNSIEVFPLTSADWPAGFLSATALKVFVYGSEFAKGSAGMVGSIDAGFQKFSNSPIIMKDKYSINGSDTAQIGWVEVTSEMGTSGYLWYLKSEHETRLRFEDYLEMTMVEAQKATATIDIVTGVAGSTTDTGKNVRGTEGLFAAIESRGLVYNDAEFYQSATGLGEFDTILQELDKQGAIEENMLFLNRLVSLDIDTMLAAQNSYGTGGTSYGVFNNAEDMALNLGFSGFRRGSYDFYKTDWKYLNDAATRGLTQDIDGVVVPAGVSTVYDQTLGKNIQRPFLHVRYRASEADDRRMKSWITGSVGGNYTSDIDEMNVHMLSERCLCVQGANNFVLLKSTQVPS